MRSCSKVSSPLKLSLLLYFTAITLYETDAAYSYTYCWDIAKRPNALAPVGGATSPPVEGAPDHDIDCDDDANFPGGCANTFDTTQITVTLDINNRFRNIPVQCAYPALEKESLRCAKTCFKCCKKEKYLCNNPDSSKDFDCDGKKAKCDSSDPQQKALMAQMCPRTCGTCDKVRNNDGSLKTHCVDQSEDCASPDFKKLCDQPEFQERMHRLCPVSCGADCDKILRSNATTGRVAGVGKVPEDPNCRDTGDNCDANILLCDNEFYKSIMTTDCRKTCGLCVLPGFKCQDKNKADCDRWNANGFCTSKDYPTGMKLQNCAATCGLC
ncbi:shK domain-like domain-containing protein [Ditylenchus destructor]|uniref:ShK domain-like domain-containing protein n=1 Tax=Ditylenchus destructor TaxID=166010 RepID=A0AAD4N0E3_9BILA|nr:shK domain-like domain-containing protein [Ditylenchus destructor]